MPQTENDTISAICTAPGGALSILRVSGPRALEILNAVTAGRRPVRPEDARKVFLRHALAPDGESCLVFYMPGPASYTGEDVAEIQCHGGDFAPLRLFHAVCEAGARPAEGGEFTRRAFLNGKLDLTQAEAVADLIHAKSEAAGRLAERQMAGRLGDQIRLCREILLHVLAEIESRMDFPEEDLDWLPADELEARIRGVARKLDGLLETAQAGVLLRNGIRLVIAGAPNAGKSSLLKSLLGYDRAIVSEQPGTTRDTVEENLSIRGLTFRAADTAGIRETEDPAEQQGVRRARSSIASADVVIWLIDLSEPERLAERIRQFIREKPEDVPVILCWNKSDLPHEPPPSVPDWTGKAVELSVRSETGIRELSAQIAETMWAHAGRHEPESAVSERHASLLRQAGPLLAAAEGALSGEEWELAASPLREAVHSLGVITGESADPDILDEIFSRFCIGK